VLPQFFQACGTLRGMKAQVPGPPLLSTPPILKLNSPSKTQATSSLFRCRWNQLLVPAGTACSNIMMLPLVWSVSSFR
jgi:hypothetical protein